MAAAFAISVNATLSILENSARVLRAMKVSTRCASFTSLAFNASSTESLNNESAPTTKINARKMETCINQCFTMISRVSRLRLLMSANVTFSLTQTDANIQCIARVRYDDKTVCEYKFTYELEEDNEVNIRIAVTTCPPTNYALVSIFSIILFTFFIGLIFILIYKVKIHLADKREFAKFEEDKGQTKYDFDSPLYKSPISKFENPQIERLSQNVFELK